jgi:hypothetical protein
MSGLNKSDMIKLIIADPPKILEIMAVKIGIHIVFQSTMAKGEQSY